MRNPTVYIAGTGAISPAGWGVSPMLEALNANVPLQTSLKPRPGWPQGIPIRTVPSPTSRPPFLAHPRMRRSSPISQYSVGAALEALGPHADAIRQGQLRLGIILCVMSGCVNYSRRFYDEALKDPATASPMVFPETVFNAPASHLTALLDSKAINYTLVGDPGTFLQGLALGAEWLLENKVDLSIVVGTEEQDWLTASAFTYFSKQVRVSEGAGAVLLSLDKTISTGVTLDTITDSILYLKRRTRSEAVQNLRFQLNGENPTDLLVDGQQGCAKFDGPESSAFADWKGRRISPRTILGEGLMAGAAWQTIVAIKELERATDGRAYVSMPGLNQQAIGAIFARHTKE